MLAGGLLLLGSYGVQDALAVREALLPTMDDGLHSETLDWIRQATPGEARFAAFYEGPFISLYTGIWEPPRFEFEPIAQTQSMATAWDRFAAVTRIWPKSFVRVYENRREKTAIFHFVPDPRFAQAYELYSAALEDFGQSSWEAGFRKIEESLRLEPVFPSALNAYGASCLITGRNLRVAEQRLREALRIRPDYIVAQRNLKRLMEQRGLTGRGSPMTAQRPKAS
jgi:tetratricopeptide (TPR) repeat protein